MNWTASLKHWFLHLFQTKEKARESKYIRQPKSEILNNWRKKGFEYALAGMDIKGLVSLAQTEMSDLKITASNQYALESIDLKDAITQGNQELSDYRSAPEEYLQRTIDQLPDRDHKKVIALTVKLTRVEEDLRNNSIKLIETKNRYGII